MNILYYTKPFLLDCDFPYIKSLRKLDYNVTTLINLSPYHLRSTLIDIKKQYPKNGIFPVSIYKELACFDSYINNEMAYVVNRLSSNPLALSNLILNFKLVLFVFKHKINIIHTTDFYSYIDFLMYLFRKKTILTVHDPIPHTGEVTKKNSFFRAAAFRLFSNFVLLNKAQRDIFVSRYRLESKNIFISRLSVYSILEEYLDYNNLKKDKSILFFGRISPYKGIEYLLQAMECVSKERSDILLVVAGAGEYYFDIRQYSKMQNVKFINRFIPISELASLISNALFVVCPYTDATQSGVVMSSYALCRPIIATSVGGMQEVIENNVTGLLIPPRNTEALAQAILKLVNNEDVIKQMEHNIQNIYMKGSKSWDAIAQGMNEAYFSIIRKK